MTLALRGGSERVVREAAPGTRPSASSGLCLSPPLPPPPPRTVDRPSSLHLALSSVLYSGFRRLSPRRLRPRFSSSLRPPFRIPLALSCALRFCGHFAFYLILYPSSSITFPFHFLLPLISSLLLPSISSFFCSIPLSQLSPSSFPSFLFHHHYLPSLLMYSLPLLPLFPSPSFPPYHPPLFSPLPSPLFPPFHPLKKKFKILKSTSPPLAARGFQRRPRRDPSRPGGFRASRSFVMAGRL